jgi:hypothetical protein
VRRRRGDGGHRDDVSGEPGDPASVRLNGGSRGGHAGAAITSLDRLARPYAALMAARREGDEPPEVFRVAVETLRAGAQRCARPELSLEETPAPQRLAPYAAALSADVTSPGGAEMATGRLVLLHDPAGHETWEGTLRLVTYLRAGLEPDLAGDPLLPGVGWTWLLESLEAAGASHRAASGTVTRIASESFGKLADRPATADIEIRASWTPTEPDLRPHLTAWCQLLGAAAGLPPLPPLPPGIAALPHAPRTRG